ncbi:MAG TPA: hypothetical protein VM598_04095 [Bdellovibrionota bacterium]|nr:hypothetical protein [Bdellovibrionota bacterium]
MRFPALLLSLVLALALLGCKPKTKRTGLVEEVPAPTAPKVTTPAGTSSNPTSSPSPSPSPSSSPSPETSQAPSPVALVPPPLVLGGEFQTSAALAPPPPVQPPPVQPPPVAPPPPRQAQPARAQPQPQPQATARPFIEQFSEAAFSREIPQHLLVRNGIHFYVTPRGQRYFQNRLEDFFDRNALSFQPGVISEAKFTPDEPVDFNQLPERYRRNAAMFEKAKEWLEIISAGTVKIKNPKPELAIKNVRYELNFRKFGIRIDERQAGRGMPMSSLPLILEVEIDRLKIAADRITLTDTENPAIFEAGPAAIVKPVIELARASAPITATAQVELRVHPNGKPTIRIGTPTTNLGELIPGTTNPAVQAELKFESLQLPEFEARVGGLKLKPDIEALTRQYNLHEKLVQSLQIVLAAYVRDQLPPLVQGMVARTLGDRPLSEVNVFDPPGMDPPIPLDQKFRFGLVLAGLGVTEDGNAHGDASTFFEDPKNPSTPQVPEAEQALGEPVLRAMAPETFDIAVSINQGIMNRLLQLSYVKGVFNEIPIADTPPGAPAEIEEEEESTEAEPEGKPLAMLKLLERPVLKIGRESGLDDRHGKVKVYAEAKFKFKGVRGLFTRAFVRDATVRFEVEVHARARVNRRGELTIELDKIDLDTFDLKRDNMRLSRLGLGRPQEALLTKVAKSALGKTNKTLATRPATLIKALPIPKAVAGLPLKIFDARAEPNGFFTIYLSYDFPRE